MRVAIAQPLYLAWCGFFALMDWADTLILLDTVALSKQSWQTRNRIRARDGSVVWLSVPVHASLGQRLDTVRIDNSRDWQRKHRATIEQAYGKTPGIDKIRGAIEWAYRQEWGGLTDLTVALTQSIADTLGTTTRLVLASSLGETRQDPHGRIVDLCRAAGASKYATTTGATYLDESQLEGIPVEWFHYNHPEYEPHHTTHLSVVDLLAHSPTDTLSIIRSGVQGYASIPAATRNATQRNP